MAADRDLPAVAQLGRAADQAAALSDPTRLLLAVVLRRRGELSVGELAGLCGRQDKIVSHHVRRMRAAGLARSRRDGKMILYRLTPRGAALVDAVTAALVPPSPWALG